MTLLVGWQEGHPTCKKMGWSRWALVSPDGVAPSRMVSVSASVNLSLHHKVQKFSSGTGSPRWSRKRGRKTDVVVVVVHALNEVKPDKTEQLSCWKIIVQWFCWDLVHWNKGYWLWPRQKHWRGYRLHAPDLKQSRKSWRQSTFALHTILGCAYGVSWLCRMSNTAGNLLEFYKVSWKFSALVCEFARLSVFNVSYNSCIPECISTKYLVVNQDQYWG